MHSCRHAFIFVLMYCFRFIMRVESVRFHITFKFKTKTLLKPFENHCWKYPWIQNLMQTWFQFKTVFWKESPKSFISKILVIQNLNWISKSYWFQKSQNPKAWFSKTFKFHFEFSKLASIYLKKISLFKTLDLNLNIFHIWKVPKKLIWFYPILNSIQIWFEFV